MRSRRNLEVDRVNIEFTIPRVPLSPNRMLRMHWGTRAKDMREWTMWLGIKMTPSQRLSLRQTALRVKRMEIGISIYHKSRRYLFDPDNLVGSVKHFLDAMRQAKFLKDDSPQHLKLTVSQDVKGTHEVARTEIQVGPEE